MRMLSIYGCGLVCSYLALASASGSYSAAWFFLYRDASTESDSLMAESYQSKITEKLIYRCQIDCQMIGSIIILD